MIRVPQQHPHREKFDIEETGLIENQIENYSRRGLILIKAHAYIIMKAKVQIMHFEIIPF